MILLAFVKLCVFSIFFDGLILLAFVKLCMLKLYLGETNFVEEDA